MNQKFQKALSLWRMCSCTLGVLGFSHVLSQNFYLKWFSEADRYKKLWENEKILNISKLYYTH